jgi:hypothetical protein
MVYAVERASRGMICLLNFVNIVADVQAVLRFFLYNLNDCNDNISDGRDF